jgi:methionine-rich copper-binding protein CopC
MKQLFLLLFLTLGQNLDVSAHAVVTDDSLKINPVQENQAGKVALRFNSKIELGLSQIFLVRKGDKHELLTVTAGKQQGQIIVDLPALAAGDYALRIKVFAADGHLTEDVIHFSVKALAAKAEVTTESLPAQNRI